MQWSCPDFFQQLQAACHIERSNTTTITTTTTATYYNNVINDLLCLKSAIQDQTFPPKRRQMVVQSLRVGDKLLCNSTCVLWFSQVRSPQA